MAFIPSTNRHEKRCQMLEIFFVVFHHSKKYREKLLKQDISTPSFKSGLSNPKVKRNFSTPDFIRESRLLVDIKRINFDSVQKFQSSNALTEWHYIDTPSLIRLTQPLGERSEVYVYDAQTDHFYLQLAMTSNHCLNT